MDGDYVQINQLVVISIVFSVAIICLTAMVLTIFIKIPSKYGQTIRKALERIEFLKLSTIIVVIISATYLALFDKLNEGIVGI
uniref:hypothetical protein n=1 Tax=uncultured Kiloniella sp. TaxID=1133091 RepID=UPI0026087783